MADEREDEIAALKARLAALEADKSEPPPTPTPVQQTPSSGFSAGFMGCFGVLAAIVLVFVILAVIGGANSTVGDADTGARGYTAPAAPPAPAWSYSTYNDEMSGRPETSACIDSSALIRLDWPYEAQYPRLCIRQSPRHGQDVIIRLPKGGQFICRSYNNCTIKVRFDEGEIQSFSAAEAADSSTDILFVTNDRRFVTAMRNAEMVRIEAEIYQAGAPTMVFPVKDFDAERAGL